jgi:tetratricopeptide (TPR) repeat protein
MISHSSFSRFGWIAGLLLGCASIQMVCAMQVSAQAQGVESEYQSVVQKGLHEYELGNFSEAKAFFLRAHTLSPNARTLRGLGMSSYELRNYVEAIDYFQKALDASERPLTAHMRGEVSQLLSQARSFVTRLTLTVQPANAQVHLDTREVSRDTDGNVLMDPGTHQLVVEAPDCESVTRAIRTDGNETLLLNISLRNTRESLPVEGQPIELEPDLAPAVPQPSAPGTATETTTAQSSSLAPWIVVGASSVVAIAGGVLLAIALSNKHDVENAKGSAEQGPRYEDYRSKESSVLPLSVAGITALSVGIAGVTAGMVWKIAGGRSDERASARLSITPFGVSARGRF